MDHDHEFNLVRSSYFGIGRMSQLPVVGGEARRSWPLAVIVVIIAVAGALMWVVWRSPHRSDLATFWIFGATLITVASPLIVYLAKLGQPGGLGQGGRLDELADALAGAVKEQWTQAAAERRLLHPEPIPVRWGRSSKPIVGPVSAAAESQQFPPLPGLTPSRQEQLVDGGLQDLHAIYGGVGSGRLLIVGTPGSGKSGAATLLLLAALKYREHVPKKDRPLVPVPVMFTFEGWDPTTQQVGDWLAAQLRHAYPFFSGKGGAAEATALVAAGRVAVILDGLDEMPAALRPVALQALSRQAAFRVVVLARSAEMMNAAAEGFLEGAVALELQDVHPEVAADYLTRVQRSPAPVGWHELTDRLRHVPDSTIAAALSSPLTLTLVRDTYREADDVRELLAFCDATSSGVSRQAIEDHLLDRVLAAAYARQPGDASSRYELHVAEHGLCYIAARMNQDGTRDLAWWRVRTWTSNGLYSITLGLAGVFIGGLVGGLGFGITGAIVGGLVTGLWYWFGAGLSSLLQEEFRTPPLVTAPVQWRQLFRVAPIGAGLLLGLVGGLIAGLVAGLAFGVKQGVAAGLVYGLASGLLGWYGGWMASALDKYDASPSEDSNASPLTPRASWRQMQIFGLVTPLRLGLVAGLVIWLGTGLSGGLGVALAGGLVVCLVGVFVFPQTWPISLAFAQLAMHGYTPIRLLRFLEDARKREVLRTVGPIYQFRHARLQDRLAQRATSVGVVPEVITEPAAATGQPVVVDEPP